MTDQEYEATLDRVKYAINNPIDNRNDHRYNDRVVQLEKCSMTKTIKLTDEQADWLTNLMKNILKDTEKYPNANIQKRQFARCIQDQIAFPD